MSSNTISVPGTSLDRRGRVEVEPVVAKIAALRSGETRLLSRQLGFDVAIIVAVQDPRARAQDLSRHWHGALRARDHWFLPWDYWYAMPSTIAFEIFEMDARWMGGAALPPGMTIDDGFLRVDLPPGARLSDFAVAFAAAMQDLTFEQVARKPGQVAYRYRTGRQLEVGARYGGRPSATRMPHVVDDLYAFRPRSIRAIVGRAQQAATLVGVRSALHVAARPGDARHA